MAKKYKRKIYMENMSRDSERCNDMRKYINSSYRQESKREVAQNILEHDTYSWYEYMDGYYGDHYYSRDDWRHYWPVTMHSLGGKFIHTLMRLDILEGGNIHNFRDLRRNGYSHHPHYQLLEKLAVTPDGIIT
jgi:hypothetical protein